jgi:hypothetical protein
VEVESEKFDKKSIKLCARKKGYNKLAIMKTTYGLSPKPVIKTSPTHQGYLGYLTHKQLQQLNKYKKEQESDKDSFVSGYSGKGRRMKLRHVKFKSSFVLNFQSKKDHL